MSQDYLFEVVVGVVRCSERGFLLVRRSENESLSGSWEFGGGAVENDETLKQAVRREAEEETGLKVEVVQRGESYLDDYSKGGKLKLHPFLLEADEDDCVELSHEHDKHKWIELEDVDRSEIMSDAEALYRLGLIE